MQDKTAPPPDKTHPMLVLAANLENETNRIPEGGTARPAKFVLADAYARLFTTLWIHSKSPFFDVLVECWKGRRHVRVDGAFELSTFTRAHTVGYISGVDPLTDEEEKELKRKKRNDYAFQRRSEGKIPAYKAASPEIKKIFVKMCGSERDL